jgi:ketopantoate reductase
MTPFKVLILGASYGSLLATKLVLAGHEAKLVCLPAEVEAFNADGAIVRLPIKGREGLVEVNSRKLPGKLSAAGPAAVKPGDYDLVVLAMQEPQYGSPGVRELMQAVAKANVPCMSIMNMPPLPYLARIPGISAQACRSCYTDPAVWDPFDPALMTLCSPDPQAFRPPEEKVNVLQVRLPTNFKSARFPSDAHTAILRTLEKDIEAARFEGMELPVKLKVHESVFVPLAKWAMLMAGNYRCITRDGMRPIKEAVHSDLEASRAVYTWVVKLCVSLGADEKDLVPFEKYAAAANGLASPSSAARALFGGARNIERVDRLVQAVAAQKGMRNPVIDEVVKLVDARLEMNRAASQAAVAPAARKTA